MYGLRVHDLYFKGFLFFFNVAVIYDDNKDERGNNKRRIIIAGSVMANKF